MPDSSPPYPSFGGNYAEYSIGCPDGEVWPDTASSEAEARSWLVSADSACGCEQSPHVVVSRDVPEWEPLDSAPTPPVETGSQPTGSGEETTTANPSSSPAPTRPSTAAKGDSEVAS